MQANRVYVYIHSPASLYLKLWWNTRFLFLHQQHEGMRRLDVRVFKISPPDAFSYFSSAVRFLYVSGLFCGPWCFATRGRGVSWCIPAAHCHATCYLSRYQHFLRISLISVHNFSSYFTNRQI